MARDGDLVLCTGSCFYSLLWPILDELGWSAHNFPFCKQNAITHLQSYDNTKNAFKDLLKWLHKTLKSNILYLKTFVDSWMVWLITSIHLF